MNNQQTQTLEITLTELGQLEPRTSPLFYAMSGGLELVNKIRPFDPILYDLDSNFRLTNYSDLKEHGWKVTQKNLLKLLQKELQCDPDPSIEGIGLRPSLTVTRLVRESGLNLVQTMDILYSLVDDPYMLGKIACANILGKLYAIGVTECENIIMTITASSNLTEKERSVVVPLMTSGFVDTALKASTNRVTRGGPNILNPWISITSVASTVCPSKDIIIPGNAEPGDVLVLTKPLGTRVALYLYQLLDIPERWKEIETSITKEEVQTAYNRAVDSMSRLNHTAAKLMHKYNAHGATEVGDYGILGHAENLARNQKEKVSIVISNLPIIAKISSVMVRIVKLFHLFQGLSPETSGGLLICFPRLAAVEFCKDIELQEGLKSWIVGSVEAGDRTARVRDKARVIEVPLKDSEGQLW